MSLGVQKYTPKLGTVGEIGLEPGEACSKILHVQYIIVEQSVPGQLESYVYGMNQAVYRLFESVFWHL